MEIMNGTHPEIRDLDKIYTDASDPKSKKEAIPYVKALADFSIVRLITSYSLHYLLPRVIDRFQGKTEDIVKGLKKITIVKETDIQMWENVQTIFHAIYL